VADGLGEALEAAGGDDPRVEVGLLQVGLLVVEDDRRPLLDGQVQQRGELLVRLLGLDRDAVQQILVVDVVVNAEILGVGILPGEGLAYDLVLAVKHGILCGQRRGPQQQGQGQDVFFHGDRPICSG
jgi:hypothetical protein